MERSGSWLIVCDLDGTLLLPGRDDGGLGALTEQLQANGCSLVYNTARSLSSVTKLMKTGRLPCPDACACELGTKIVYFPRREWSAAVDDTEWEANLLKAMDASGHPDPTAELAAFAFAEDGVAVEVEDDDSRTKASLVLRAETAELCLAASRRLIEQLGVLGDGFVVSPSGAPTTTRKNGCKMFVDVTPTAAGKGCSTAHLMSVFGATSERVLVAGDSENDVAMMRLCCGASPVAGVIVANASVELLRWHAANPGRRIVAVESGPLGVLEGFRHFAGVAPTVLQDELNTAAVSTLNYLDPAAAEVASVLRPICACEAGALTELRSREGANLTSVLQETCRQGLWLRGTACVQCIMDSDHEALRSQSMDVSACCTLALDATCSKPQCDADPHQPHGAARTAEVALAGLHVLTAHRERDESEQAQERRSRERDATLCAMARWHAFPRFVRAGCGTLWNLACQVAALRNAEAVNLAELATPQIIACCAAHENDASVQREAVGALARLAMYGGERGRSGVARAAPALIGAINRFCDTEPHIVREAALALQHLGARAPAALPPASSHPSSLSPSPSAPLPSPALQASPAAPPVPRYVAEVLQCGAMSALLHAMEAECCRLDAKVQHHCLLALASLQDGGDSDCLSIAQESRVLRLAGFASVLLLTAVRPKLSARRRCEVAGALVCICTSPGVQWALRPGRAVALKQWVDELAASDRRDDLNRLCATLRQVGEKAAAEAATLSDDAFDVRLATGAIALASIIENACAPEVAVGEQ